MTEGVPFGRYTLTGLLGRGGFATVYRAVMSGPMGFEKDVAVKRINDEVTQDPRLTRALVNEARLGGRLKHPNVVETYEFNRIGDSWFLALEFIDGWPLDALLRYCRHARSPLPVSVVYEVMIQACAGLHHAHELRTRDGNPANLIHRDLKPANLMVNRSGIVKVMDFGIAKAATNLYTTTDAEGVKGTPVYMSPEQLRGEPLDRRSDIFAMGSILHELATLKIPFYADNLLAVTYQIAECDLTPLLARVQARHPPMAEVLARCMARARGDRYASAEELRLALSAAALSAPQGVSLRRWLGEAEDLLPKPRADGDFGEEGPPGPSGGGETAAGGTTQSHPDVAELGDTLALHDDPPAHHATPPEARFSDVAPTRLVPRAVSRRAWPVPTAAGLLILVLGIAAWLSFHGGSLPNAADREGASAGSVEEGPAPATGDAPGAAPNALVATDLTIEPAIEPTPAPPRADTVLVGPPPGVEAKAGARSPPTKAEVVALPLPPKVVASAPVVDATPAQPPAIAPVIINSVPWSDVTIDGVGAGRTMLRTELAVGMHTVHLRCSACEPANEEETEFEVSAGRTNRLVHMFNP